MTDLNHVFQDDDDQRQHMDWLNHLEEMMISQELADRAVLLRIRRGETNNGDYLYMVGRLNYNLNDLEK